MKRTLFQSVGSAVLLFALFFVAQNTVSGANTAGLVGVRVEPSSADINANNAITLTVEGDYVTYNAPVEALWNIVEGKDLGSIAGCENSSSCTFAAHQYAGKVVIEANAGSFRDTATIKIIAPLEEDTTVETGIYNAANNPFNDELPDWAGNPIVELNKLGIIRGYQNGDFGAGDLLTRGQLATLLYRVLLHVGLVSEPGGCTQMYQDVAADHYAFTPLCSFASKGWIERTAYYSPDAPASRGETASLLNRIIGGPLLTARGLSLGHIVVQGQVFSDVPAEHGYFADTSVMKLLGIMTGNPDGTFGVDRTLNRAEAATVFWRLMSIVDGAGVSSL